MIKKTLKTMGIVAAAITVLGTSALAGQCYQGFNTTVAKLNGDGYTGTQKKELNGNNGRVKASSVGGGYSVDVMMEEKSGSSFNGTGIWTRNLKTGKNLEVTANGNMKCGDIVRLRFSNDALTPVAVQVTGEWKSN